MEIRRAADRGYADHGWLKTWHSFAFADYFDPAHVQFGPLRVLNDDRVAPGKGFPPHSHRDMEILTVVLAGALEHQDSTGAHFVMRPGDVQRMSAGRGVTHSEFNPSPDEPVHFLQVWMLPAIKGIAAEYEQWFFPPAERRGQLRVIASPDRRSGSLLIHQDAVVYAGRFDGDEIATLPLGPGRMAYVHVALGTADVNGAALGGGDAMKLRRGNQVTIAGGQKAEVLVFDLPADVTDAAQNTRST
jgi:quercetin 2,3-dioxygenase